jgi:hypothetical protein
MKMSAVGEARNENKCHRRRRKNSCTIFLTKFSLNARKENRRIRRRRVMKMNAVGEGAEGQLAPSPSAPNEINSTLARLFWGQIKNASKTFPSRP